MTLDEATDAEIVAAVRAGALMGDRVDLALRFGHAILAAEAKDREHACAVASLQLERDRALAESDHRLDVIIEKAGRVHDLETLLRRACVNGGSQLLREAGLS